MIVLGLDMAGTTGWAVAKDGRIIASGVWGIAPRRGESPGMRYLKLRARLAEVLTHMGQLDVVAYEQAHQRGGAATEYALGCAATVQTWCAELGIEHTAIHTATVKRCALGSAPKKRRCEPKFDWSKEAVQRAAALLWPGVTFASDDEVDARYVALAAVEAAGA